MCLLKQRWKYNATSYKATGCCHASVYFMILPGLYWCCSRKRLLSVLSRRKGLEILAQMWKPQLLFYKSIFRSHSCIRAMLNSFLIFCLLAVENRRRIWQFENQLKFCISKCYFNSAIWQLDCDIFMHAFAVFNQVCQSRKADFKFPCCSFFQTLKKVQLVCMLAWISPSQRNNM